MNMGLLASLSFHWIEMSFKAPLFFQVNIFLVGFSFYLIKKKKSMWNFTEGWMINSYIKNRELKQNNRIGMI